MRRPVKTVLDLLLSALMPLRVSRAAESYAKAATHKGQLGEIELHGSER